MANQKNHSPLWFGWLLVVTITVLLSGCQTAKPARLADKPEEDQSDDWLIVTRDSRKKYPYELTKKIRINDHHYYHIGDEKIGEDLPIVLTKLKFSGVNAVLIDSETKMMTETYRSIIASYHQAGIVVKEFWAPIAQDPGRVDRMAHYATKIVIRYTDDN